MHEHASFQMVVQRCPVEMRVLLQEKPPPRGGIGAAMAGFFEDEKASKAENYMC